MTAFACLGHWYVQILFAVPSLGIILYMGRDSLRKRRARRNGTSPPRRPRGPRTPEPLSEAHVELTDAELGLIGPVTADEPRETVSV